MSSAIDTPDVVHDPADDGDEAQWALTTARTLQDRGDMENAISWYRRAVDHLMAAGQDETALEIARLASALSSSQSRISAPVPASAPARVATQPSQVPSSIASVRLDASPIDPDDLSESGEVAARLSSELAATLRAAVCFQPMRAAEAEQLSARLAAVPLFRELPPETVRAMARQVSTIHFESGEALVTHAHSGPEAPVYVVLEGRGIVRAPGDEGPGTPLGPGDFIGEIGVLYRGTGFFAATARTSLLVAALPCSLAAWLAREFPSVRMAFEDVAWERAFNAIGRAAPFLRRLSPDQRGVIYARFEPVVLTAGDALLSEGAPPLAAWILAAGEVEVYGGGLQGRQPLRARPGDLVGLRAVAEGEPCGVTVRTLGMVLAAKIGAASLRSLLERHSTLASAIDDVGLPGRAILC